MFRSTRLTRVLVTSVAALALTALTYPASAAPPLPTLTPTAPAATAKVAAQLDADVAALHQARIDAGEVKDDSAQKKSAPHEAFYAPYECNPWRGNVIDWSTYCFHNAGFSNQSNDAILWVQQHFNADDLKPVPFPNLGDGGGGSLANRVHTVYVVKYSSAKKTTKGSVKATKIFKYGITTKAHYQTRADVGRRNCNAWAKKKGYRTNECERTWVAVTKATLGWDYARWLEGSLIKQYQLKAGVCPPGQPKSCK